MRRMISLCCLLALTLSCQKNSTSSEKDNSPVIDYSASWFTEIDYGVSKKITATVTDDHGLRTVYVDWTLNDTDGSPTGNILETHYSREMEYEGDNKYSYTFPAYNIDRDIVYQILAWDYSNNVDAVPSGYYIIRVR